jgi:hypothetical protein
MKHRIRYAGLLAGLTAAVSLTAGTTPAFAQTEDTQAPTIHSFSPGPDSYTAQGTVEVTVDVSDDVAVTRTEIVGVDAEGNVTGVLATATAAPWTMTWDVSDNMSGTVVRGRILAYDAAGNVAAEDAIVRCDWLYPTIEFPHQQDRTVTGTYELPVSAFDYTGKVKDVKLYRGTTVVASDDSYPYVLQWDTTGVNGNVEMTAVVEDRAGNAQSSSWTMFVDNAGPQVTVDQPNPGPFTGRYTADLGVTDARSGVTDVKVYAGGELIQTMTQAPFTVEWDATGRTGPVEMKAVAADRAGNTSTTTWTIATGQPAPPVTAPSTPPAEPTPPASEPSTPTDPEPSTPAGPEPSNPAPTTPVDPQPSSPVPTAPADTVSPAVTAPGQDRRYVAGVYTTDLAVSDTGSGIADVKVYAGSNLVQTLTNSPWTIAYDTRGRTGVITFKAVATDKAGNSSTTSWKIIADNTAPVVLAVAEPGHAVRGTYTAVVVPIDAGSGVDDLKLYADGALVQTITRFPGLVQYDTTGKNGPIALKIVTTDRAGNTATHTWKINADNAGPDVTAVTGPADAAKVTGTVTVTASVQDPAGVAKVELIINGKVAATDHTAPYTLKIDTAALPKKSAVQIRATDKAGNVTMKTIGNWNH